MGHVAASDRMGHVAASDCMGHVAASDCMGHVAASDRMGHVAASDCMGHVAASDCMVSMTCGYLYGSHAPSTHQFTCLSLSGGHVSLMSWGSLYTGFSIITVAPGTVCISLQSARQDVLSTNPVPTLSKTPITSIQGCR